MQKQFTRTEFNQINTIFTVKITEYASELSTSKGNIVASTPLQGNKNLMLRHENAQCYVHCNKVELFTVLSLRQGKVGNFPGPSYC